MFSKAIAWIKTELFAVEKSVESIVSNFTRTVDLLEKHAEERFLEVTHLNDVVAAANAGIDKAKAEYDKAVSVAAKIKELLK